MWAVVPTNTPQATPYRNRLINGDMRIDQRHLGAAYTTDINPYSVDRWFAVSTGANYTVQRVAGTYTGLYSLQLTGAAGATGGYVGQHIEALYIGDLAGQDVVLSVTLANSLYTTVAWQAVYANATNDWASTTTIASGTFTGVSSTMTRFSATFTLPAGAQNGVQITFSPGAMTSGTFKVTDVQLEAGTIATAYERLPATVQQLLCSRYFQIAGLMYGHSISATQLALLYISPVPLRAAPTVTLLSTSLNGECAVFSSAISTTSGTLVNSHYNFAYASYGFDIEVGGFTGLTANTPASLYGGYISINAEM